MSTTPPVIVSSASKLQTILQILNAALQGLSLVPGPIGAGSALAVVFENIIANAVKAIQNETGQPIDLSKLPLETPVP